MNADRTDSPRPDGAQNSLGAHVRRARVAGQLVVQPRMGFSGVAEMRAGLIAIRSVPTGTAGTITLDSYTRVGDHAAAHRALRTGTRLNGFPLVAHGAGVVRSMLDGVCAGDFPVQVRHGSADPRAIVATLIAARIDSSEGGPVSYCLPYGRTPLRVSVRNWARSCETLAGLREQGLEPHLESFGGCMLGQLGPPGLLVAITVIEAMFFRQHGIRDVSLSYAQQGGAAQDLAAVAVLRELADRYLPDVHRHVVVYTYMGVFPRSPEGALALVMDSARLAAHAAADRLIVKTAAEAWRIPTVAENVVALRAAAAAADQARRADTPPVPDAAEVELIRNEAVALIEAVLDLGPDLGGSLLSAFERGYLDVPYCLHADNRKQVRSTVDDRGHVRWADTGVLPIPRRSASAAAGMTATGLLHALSRVQRTYDERGLGDVDRALLRACTPDHPTTAPSDPMEYLHV